MLQTVSVFLQGWNLARKSSEAVSFPPADQIDKLISQRVEGQLTVGSLIHVMYTPVLWRTATRPAVLLLAALPCVVCIAPTTTWVQNRRSVCHACHVACALLVELAV